MELRKLVHIFFALAAISQNFISCCVSSRCERAEDLNPPNCNIEDLSDKVLIGMCKTAGLPIQAKLPRNKIVSAAKLCYEFHSNYGIDDLKDEELIDICKRVGFPIPQNPTREQLLQSAIICSQDEQYDQYMNNEKVGKCGTEDNKAEYVACLERDAKRLHIEYLQRMVGDESFISKDRNDRMSYLLSKYNIDDVPEEEKVMRQLLLTLIEKEEGVIEVPIPSQCERPEDIALPSCKAEDVLMSSDQYKLADLSDKQCSAGLC